VNPLATDEPSDADDPVAAPPIVLYDGVCGLCSRAVRWLMDHDRSGSLRFAPLQGSTAEDLRRRFPQIPATLESVVLVDGDRVFIRSKMFLHVAKHLNAPWRWAFHVRWLPAWPLDLGYRLVARLRYRVWGKHDECRIPTLKDRSRMLP
jgi:predicted DCC family thiol-disulfide oxidoreductase YuxK